jgi:hypothetical protein
MRHVSAETMAQFRQGDLSVRRSSRVSTHLASCDRCSALNGDLGRVATLLASTQRPRMPDEVTARMQAALAAESAARAADRGTAADVGARAPAWRPRLPQISSRLALRGLAAAAAAVVLAGGGYLIVAATGASSTGSGSAESSPAGVHAPAGAPGYAPLMVPAHAAGPSVRYQHDGHESRITPISTGTDFTRAGLASQAAAAVVRYGTGFATAVPDAAGPARTSGALSTASAANSAATLGTIPVSMMAGCVNRIDAGDLVLLVDVAHYEGAPATVIVTEATRVGPMRIWVVGADCSASRSDMLAHAKAATP